MALCHSLASYGATLPSFLVSTRNQSKSDSPRAFLSPLLAAPSQLLIAFQRSTMLVRRIIALRETFPSLSKSNDILERSAILSEEWKLDATPTFSDDGATTRSERNGREFGVEASLHFYETPSHPHSSVYNGGAFHAASCSRFVHRVVRSPVQFLHDNLYEKYFPPFPRHRRCFPSREESSRKCRPSNYRPGFAARTSGWAKIPSTRLKAATKRGKEFPS